MDRTHREHKSIWWQAYTDKYAAVSAQFGSLSVRLFASRNADDSVCAFAVGKVLDGLDDILLCVVYESHGAHFFCQFFFLSPAVNSNDFVALVTGNLYSNVSQSASRTDDSHEIARLEFRFQLRHAACETQARAEQRRRNLA